MAHRSYAGRPGRTAYLLATPAKPKGALVNRNRLSRCPFGPTIAAH